jgi:hypothetical protein
MSISVLATVNDGATDDFGSIAADPDIQLEPLLMFHKVPEGKSSITACISTCGPPTSRPKPIG